MAHCGMTELHDGSAKTLARHARRTLRYVPGRFAFAMAMAIAVVPVMAQQKVKLATTAGHIVIQLDPARAPQSVENFLKYVQDGHYDSTIFHRVVENFVIQGGGFSVDGSEKPTRAPIPLERNGLSNVRGTVAMARSTDPNSATAQFFINVRDNAFLDAARSRDGNGYTVFGRVTSGMETVETIRLGSTDPDSFPYVPVIIKLAIMERVR
jgi:peptidyl-prolyl cis-trans isomerase A (cyclophilin A)